MQIEIYIRSLKHDAQGVARFPVEVWEALSPVGKVLAIHDQRRDVTLGKPFEITREVRV